MAVTAEAVKQLRERTGAGMMECKKALDEAQGDMEAAIDHLRKQGSKTAEKKASRETKEGRVAASVSDDGKTGALVGLSCETDFVAATPDFQSFLQLVVETAHSVVRGSGPEATAALMAAPSGSNGDRIETLLTQVVGKLGENIRIASAARFEVERGVVAAYVHHNHKVGALVALGTGADRAKAEDVAKKLCQHIAFHKPRYLVRGEVPADVVERERKVHLESEELASRPAEMREKIVTGKIEKFFQASALVEQPWIFDDKLSVQKALAHELGADARIEAFALIEL